jgi:hypothetical protein
VCAHAVSFLPDPLYWSRDDVIKWMNWTMQQFNVLPVKPIQDWVLEGRRMLQLPESSFKDNFLQVPSLATILK